MTITMSAIFEKLAEVGLDENFVRRLGLPSWWPDSMIDSPSAVYEAAGHIAQRLHLCIESLLDPNQRARFQPVPEFHNREDRAFFAISYRLAEVVGLSTDLDFDPDSTSEAHSLLDYCWQRGIAVVHFEGYPQGTRAASVTHWVEDRPVIVLASPRSLAPELNRRVGLVPSAELPLTDGAETINGLLGENIVWENLSDDAADYLEQIIAG